MYDELILRANMKNKETFNIPCHVRMFPYSEQPVLVIHPPSIYTDFTIETIPLYNKLADSYTYYIPVLNEISSSIPISASTHLACCFRCPIKHTRNPDSAF